MRRLHDVCTVGTCGRPHKARGYCQTHYMQYKRGVPVVPEIRSRVRPADPECSKDGCSDPVKAKGLCATHYQRLLRHGHTKYRDRKRPAKSCTKPGCSDILYSNGLCSVHHNRARMLTKYRMSSEDYEVMLDAQRGVCAVCGQPERAVGIGGRLKSLAVDHCHETGKVRGLLCSHCNRAIGLLGDNPETLHRAMVYLLAASG